MITISAKSASLRKSARKWNDWPRSRRRSPGLRGLVCSPLEIAALRKILPAAMQLHHSRHPHGAKEKADDQKRTLSPREAIAAGANWLVIGLTNLCRRKSPRRRRGDFGIVNVIQQFKTNRDERTKSNHMIFDIMHSILDTAL